MSWENCPHFYNVADTLPSYRLPGSRHGCPTDPLKEASNDVVGTLPNAQQELPKPDSVSHQTIFVLGDLHGDLEATIAILLASHLIEFLDKKWTVDRAGNHLRLDPKFEKVLRWAGKNAVLVQLGDIVDRGPDGYLILKLFIYLFDQARERNGNIIHILGNHEVLSLQGDYSFMDPVEVLRHYDNNVNQLRKAWSAQGEIGRWIRERFLVSTTLNNRFLFVHAGLRPLFSNIPEEQLKKCIFNLIDGKPKQTRKDPQGADSKDVCLWDDMLNMKAFKFSFMGRDGPFWLREFSVMPEKGTCPDIHKTLRNVFPIPPDQDPKAVRQSETEPPVADPKFMFVGHTVTESGNIEVRCNCQSQNSQAYVNPHPSFYIMLDTGISRYVRGTGRILKIIQTRKTIYMDQIASNGAISPLLTVPLDNPCRKARVFSTIRSHNV